MLCEPWLLASGGRYNVTTVVEAAAKPHQEEVVAAAVGHPRTEEVEAAAFGHQEEGVAGHRRTSEKQVVDGRRKPRVGCGMWETANQPMVSLNL